MGPRKRAKPSPDESGSVSFPTDMPSNTSSSSNPESKENATSVIRQDTAPVQPEGANGEEGNAGSTGASSTRKLQATSKQARKTRSWYGSLPRKSSASTQVARETIHGGTLRPTATADFSRFETRKNPEAASIGDITEPSPSLPNIPEDSGSPDNRDPKPTQTEPDHTPKGPETDEEPSPNDYEGAKDKDKDDTKTLTPNEPAAKAEAEQAPRATSTWFGWFGKSTEPGPAATAAENPAPVSEPADIPSNVTEEPSTTTPDISNQSKVEEIPVAAPGRSWFGLWSNTAAPLPPPGQSAPGASQLATTSEDVIMQDAPLATGPLEGPPEPPPKSGSTWAFWSRDTGSKSDDRKSMPESGQLAVIGESSESHPKQANSVEIKDTPAKEPSKSARKEERGRPATPPVKETSSKKPKRLRPQSMEIDESIPASPSHSRVDIAPTPESSSKPGSSSKTPIIAKTAAPNLLLPSFRSTYKMKDNPSILRQIAQLLLRTKSPPVNHVFLTSEPPKIKRAIAIGVHGLFPANFLRPMIGQPTGTSIRFANHCAEAIRRWAKSHGCDDCEIEKVALEGDGKIGERVENLWKLLLNWIDHIRKADLVILACHSQGVPVGLMLLAKLIELGVITTAKIGVCAMAGVSLGPFPDYRSSMGMLMTSANELWEFANPASENSQRLENAVKVVLNYGARITYVGSMDDQLIPIESAIYSPAHHPYIYRAVFIDGRIHAPDFIAHLIGFALKLRNLGISDHGLIRELSPPLAGSLVSGEGHSRLYDEDQVYDLAVTHTLETTDVGNVPCEIRQHEGLTNPNPYHLPWIMRGLLEEDFVKTELSAETAELLRQFDDWKPVTKALRDVKYRLEVVRSKL